MRAFSFIAFNQKNITTRKNNIKTIAFPSVSCGEYRFPIDEACRITVDTVEEYLREYDYFEKVIFINPSEDIVEIYNKIIAP